MEQLEYVDRRSSGCIKWDVQKETFGEEGLLGMWVADMDFKAPLCVRAALHAAVEQGVFGYNAVPESYYDAFIAWESARHGYDVQRDYLRFSPGVVFGFSLCVQMLTRPDDAILIQPPVYYPFARAVRNNGRRLIEAPLRCTDGVYDIDLAVFERAIAENDVKAFILSSPHNPAGRVWRREELAGMLKLCRKYNVYVISDEIHHDIVFPGHEHIPTATVGDYDDIVVTLTAPSKTFNLAGCQNSIVIIPDTALRERFDALTATLQMQEGNLFGYAAAEAAYRGGVDWLAAVLDTVWGNYIYAKAALTAALPKVVISPLEGTYLMWLDFSAYLKPEQMEDFFQKRCRLALDYGAWFGGGADCCVRINLATCRENVELTIAAICRELQR